MQNSWQPTPQEITDGLLRAGWITTFSKDGTGWRVQSDNFFDGVPVTVEAYGVTQLTALWQLMMELVKLIPYPKTVPV